MPEEHSYTYGAGVKKPIDQQILELLIEIRDLLKDDAPSLEQRVTRLANRRAR